MKIGDRVFVSGYIDEIRKDTVIIRNNGGYFGTIPSEVITGELPSAQPEYEPVTAEDFAKTMSETSVYSYMLWHSEALTLMKKQGFVICKKTM